MHIKTVKIENCLKTNKMRSAEEIYEDAVKYVLDSGNQSIRTMAMIAIENTKKEVFQFLYDQILLDENKSLSLQEFFDKIDAKSIF